MIGRRNFLKVMGIGTAAAPIAAKAAAEQEIAKLTTLAGHGGAALAGSQVESPEFSVSASGHSYLDNFIKMKAYIQTTGGVPPHVERKAREDASYVSHLDPDIACKRSWSLNIKIQEQRKRNYERQIETWTDPSFHKEAQRRFEQLTGFRWIW